MFGFSGEKSYDFQESYRWYYYTKKQILDDVQLDRFTEVIKNYPEWYDFFYTEITTGLRRGEICELKWSDLDFKTGVIKISRSITIETGS